MAPGLVPLLPTALACGAGQRVTLGLAVHVGEAGLADLVNGGVHHGLPLTQLDFLPSASPSRPATVSHGADIAAVSLLTPAPPARQASIWPAKKHATTNAAATSRSRSQCALSFDSP
jgi:hypothetical protein